MAEIKGDLISREALRKAIRNSNLSGNREWLLMELDKIIDNTQAIEITEEQAIDKLHETGWLIEHDKEMTTRPTVEELEKKYAKLERKLNALISCLYPYTIGIDDVQFIEKESEGE